MAKMGRPKAENPRNNFIGVKMTDDEVKKLREYAASHDITLTEVILRALELLYKKKEN